MTPILPASTAQETTDPLIGAEFDDLRLLSVIGRGGVGVVYEAQQSGLNRRVAVKLLAPQFATQTEYLLRFQSEARIAARLRHPNVVEVYNIGTCRHGHYLVMELVRGASMTEIIRRDGPLPWREATRIVLEVCRALTKAHRLELVHRDIKPGNILRAHDGAVKLTDFGLSKNLQSPGEALTVTGGVVGTPSYMSPEQARARPVDARSDLYSLGATYYAMIVGQPPFARFTDMVQLVFAHCAEPVPDPCERRPELPAAVNQLIQRAMAKEPADRFPSAERMLLALEDLLGLDRAAGGETRIGSRSTRTFARFRSAESRSRPSVRDIPVGAEPPEASNTSLAPDGLPCPAVVLLTDSSMEPHTAATGSRVGGLPRSGIIGSRADNPSVTPLPEDHSPSLALRPAVGSTGLGITTHRVRMVVTLAVVTLLVAGAYLLANGQLPLRHELGDTDTAADADGMPAEKPAGKSPAEQVNAGPEPALGRDSATLPMRVSHAEPRPTTPSPQERVPEKPASLAKPQGVKPIVLQRPRRTLELAGGVRMVLAELPAGEFDMGSPSDQPRQAPNEVPLHRVRLTRPFWIGVYEVSQAQFQAVMEGNPSAMVGDDLPVENVTWEDAVAFCSRLSARTGLHIRLPTEAEWEYACRAGSSEPFAWLEEPTGEMPANFNGSQAYGERWSFAAAGANRYFGKPRPVGGSPNAWGLHDLHGNVAEWCHDGLRTYPADPNPQTVRDPLGPTDPLAPRAVRGGGWASFAHQCRCSARSAEPPGSRRFDRGFRIVMFARAEDDPLTPPR